MKQIIKEKYREFLTGRGTEEIRPGGPRSQLDCSLCRWDPDFVSLFQNPALVKSTWMCVLGETVTGYENCAKVVNGLHWVAWHI